MCWANTSVVLFILLSKFDKCKEIKRIGQVHHNEGVSHQNAAVWLFYAFFLDDTCVLGHNLYEALATKTEFLSLFSFM